MVRKLTARNGFFEASKRLNVKALGRSEDGRENMGWLFSYFPRTVREIEESLAGSGGGEAPAGGDKPAGGDEPAGDEAPAGGGDNAGALKTAVLQAAAAALTAAAGVLTAAAGGSSKTEK